MSEMDTDGAVSGVMPPGDAVTDGTSRGGARKGHSLPARIQHNGGTLIPIRSTEQAREMARKRWDAMSRAARLGLADAGGQIPDLRKQAPLAVIRYLVEQHTLNAADPSARGSQASFRQVVELAYPKPEREVGPTGGGEPGAAGELATLDAAALDALMAALRARVARDNLG